ncbi:MAG: NHLP bacteriocin export ABC transporter permease/ATPase subunit [Arcobacteraceae bacterium]
MNNITIYSNNPLKLYEANALFMVKKGSVNVFALLPSGKKEYITSFVENEIFFSLKNFRNEEISIELFAGLVEPVISAIDFEPHNKIEIETSIKKFEKYLADYENKLEDINNKNNLFEYLNRVFQNFTQNIQNELKLKENKELEKLNASITNDNKLIKKSILNLASIFNEELKEFEVDAQDNLLFSTIKRVCNELQIPVKDINLEYISEDNPILDIAKALHVKIRPITLKNEWYKNDVGVLLGFTKEHIPVALVPNNSSSYNIINLKTNQKTKIESKNVSELLEHAYMFYRPLLEKSLNYKDLLSFISFGNKRDLIYIILLGTITGLLALVNPLVIGKLFDEIIPQAEESKLFQIAIALFVAAISAALFSLVNGLFVAKVRCRVSLNLQSAVWDRLINLPTSFFKKYSTGDLAMRANGIEQIQTLLSAQALSALLNGIFSIFSFLLLFKYSAKLALIALLIIVIGLALNIISTVIQLKYLEKILAIKGDISSFLLEVINGIQKLKVANATNRAYSKWVEKFYIQRKLSYRLGFLQNYLEVFNTVFPLLTSIVIFAAVSFSLKEDMQFSTGDFIAFNAAFGQFVISLYQLTIVFMTILSIKPIYERVKPILEAIPETQEENKNPGILAGNIEIKNLSFKYTPEGKNILTNININIKSKEFIAIVGSSGSGKSTLLRLLLGFETPNEGNVFYDNQNIQEIDIRAVRSQLGVVLQNGRLMPGDIFSNIVGSSNKTIKDAWTAAIKAGFDEDIKQMPMGMHTVISDGGTTLSGGQRQRLLIARSLINNPKIIYFDEATSALDNKTQEIVTESLDSLNVSRVVIAHRLSTIKNADKIYVLDGGRVVQEGTYDELIVQEGLFQELAKRQIS